MLKPSSYTRRLSFNERIFLFDHHITHKNHIQIMLEGEGRIEPRALEAAVREAAKVNPGCRLVLRGFLAWTKWRAIGPLPSVRLLSEWTSDAHFAALDGTLSPVDGPTCELVLINGSPSRVVFRCFHGVMDASGLLHFAQDVFRILRGEAPLGAPCEMNDTEFAVSLVGKRRRAAVKSNRRPVRELVSNGDSQPHAEHLAFAGAIPSLVAKLCAVLAQEARLSHSEPLRIIVPVDVRHYKKDLLSTGNRSYPLMIDVSAEQSWQDVQKLLLKGILAKDALQLDPAETLVPYLPIWIPRLYYKLWVAGHRRSGRFPFSALISHLTVQNKSSLSGGGFICKSFYLLPPANSGIPLSIAIGSTADMHHVVLITPPRLMATDAFKALCKSVETFLRPSLTAPSSTDLQNV